MKNKAKLSIILSVVALAFSTFVFTSCTKNDVAAANSQDAIVLMQNAAADNNLPTFDSTMCHGHGPQGGGPHGKGPDGMFHNDSLYTHTQLTQAQLPASVAAYITANYPTATFKDAVQIVLKSSGATQSYLVLLDNAGVKTALRFDGTGTFVDARSGGHTGPGIKGSEAAFDITKIPASATAAITANFAGYAASSAESVSVNGTIIAYEVTITKGTSTKMLLFDANWKFLGGH